MPTKDKAWVLNNNTDKQIYVAVSRNRQSSAIEVAISFNQALLKTRFPNRLHCNIVSLKAIKLESPEPNILLEYCTNDKNDIINISKSEQGDIGIINISKKGQGPQKKLLN